MEHSLRIPAAAIVCGQLLASLVGAAGVICVGPGGHAAIELAHAGVCEELSGAGRESLNPLSGESSDAMGGFDLPADPCEDSDLSLSSAAPGFGRQVVQPDVAVHPPCVERMSGVDAVCAAAGWAGERAAPVRAGPGPSLFAPLLI